MRRKVVCLSGEKEDKMGSSAALAPAVWGSKLAAALLFALIGAMGAAIPAFLNKCKCIRAVGFLSSFAGGEQRTLERRTDAASCLCFLNAATRKRALERE